MAEEAIVDHHVAIDLPDAGGSHLPCQRIDAGERIGRGQD